MPAGGVDVRLDGRQLAFVVDSTPPAAPMAPMAPVPPAPPTPPAPPLPPEDVEDGGMARITLRLPESVKAKAEDSAAEAGFSLKPGWSTSSARRPAATASTSTSTSARSADVRQRLPVRRRPRAARPQADERLGLKALLAPPAAHTRSRHPAGAADEHALNEERHQMSTTATPSSTDLEGPVNLHVENGKGTVEVPATDTDIATVDLTGADVEDVRVDLVGDDLYVIARSSAAGSSAATSASTWSSRSRPPATSRPSSAAPTLSARGSLGTVNVRSGSGDIDLETRPARRCRDRLRRRHDRPRGAAAAHQERLR